MSTPKDERDPAEELSEVVAELNEVVREPLTEELPLAETINSVLPLHLEGDVTRDMSFVGPIERYDSTITIPAVPVALGETLQLVKFTRRERTLMITGLTPHGRRLTFEQREDREGWYVVAGGRRRRPTERELLLVVASITQEMEAATAPDGESEVRSAYRLAASSDQPGIPVRGLQAYRDLLIDEAAAFTYDQIDSLAVVAIEYQAFKRFAIRHGHRVAAAFVRALGERLSDLFEGEENISVFHKAGKAYRMVVVNRSSAEVREVVAQITTDDSRKWIVDRVWGKEPRTNPNEVHFHVGVARARASERDSDFEALAQRLNDDAFRASRVGQLLGHTSIEDAKNDYRTTVYQWLRTSPDDLEALAVEMDDGPAEVMAEMNDYLHELSPAELEGMAVEGDVHALIHKAIARDNFWQGTTAMRIAFDRLIERFMGGASTPPGENDYVGGFALGDEFYGIALEGGQLHFAWGDLNSAGATRLRAGIDKIHHAVGWRREDEGGIVGGFIRALCPDASGIPLAERIRWTATTAFEEVFADPEMHVNDSVDIAGLLETAEGDPIENADITEGAKLILRLPGKRKVVTVIERRSSFIARLEIDGSEHPAALSETPTGPQVKLRIRDTVVSAAICILTTTRDQLTDILSIIREDNNLDEDAPIDVAAFMRHIADILLMEQVKLPAKVELALGSRYRAEDFVRELSLEDAREHHPGLFYEAVHVNLLVDHAPQHLDRNLRELIVQTMLAKTRPRG
jgi:GGDEF domain-containing protein